MLVEQPASGVTPSENGYSEVISVLCVLCGMALTNFSDPSILKGFA
jgi:hypothetical protein